MEDKAYTNKLNIIVWSTYIIVSWLMTERFICNVIVNNNIYRIVIIYLVRIMLVAPALKRFCDIFKLPSLTSFNKLNILTFIFICMILSIYEQYDIEINSIILIFSIQIIIVILEELVFRKLIFDILMCNGEEKIFVIYSALLFSFVHVQLISEEGIKALLIPFIAGIFFSVLYKKNNDLTMSITAHYEYNMISILCIDLLPMIMSILALLFVSSLAMHRRDI